jgi:hypothetical protein
MNELDLLARKYGTDKRTNDPGQNIYHSYTEFYYDIFKDEKLKYTNILEIGVMNGASHFMWKDFFPNAMIYGIENFSDPACVNIKKEDIECNRIKIIIGDQSDENLINENFKNIIFDMIVDDGSHRSWHQQKSFKYLWPKLKSGGIYIIEDLGVCQIREFREFDDIRSATTEWIKSIVNGNYFSYYNISRDEIGDIDKIMGIGELGVFYKK